MEVLASNKDLNFDQDVSAMSFGEQVQTGTGSPFNGTNIFGNLMPSPISTPNKHHAMNQPLFATQSLFATQYYSTQQDYVPPNVKIDDLSNGIGEWSSIEPIVRMTFKYLCVTIAQQNHTIHSLNNRVQYCERQLKDKVTRAEVAIEVNRGIKSIQQFVETKASIVEVGSLLEKKANKDDVKYALQCKANAEEMKSLLDLKADASDMSSMFDIHNLGLSELKQDLNRKAIEIDSIRNRTEESLLELKSDFNESMTANYEELSSRIEQVSSDCLQRPKVDAIKTILESGFDDHAKLLEDCMDSYKQLEENVKSTVEKFDQLNTKMDRKAEIDDVNQVLFLKANVDDVRSYLEATITRDEVLSLITNHDTKVNELLGRKADKEQLDSKADVKHVKEALAKKVNTSALASLQQELEHRIQAQEESIKEEIEKKTKGVVGRESIVLALRKKLSTEDFTSFKNEITKKVDDEIKTVVDRHEQEISIIRDQSNNSEDSQAIASLRKEIALKANMNDVVMLLDSKANAKDVDESIKKIQLEQTTMTLPSPIDPPVDGYRWHFDQAVAMNEAVLALNTVARWTWNGQTLKNGNGVPWSAQVVNTSPENFIWRKDHVTIIVVQPGLYEICFGFFSSKKATVQLHVNGEAVLTVHPTSYVLHHSDKHHTIHTHKHHRESGVIAGLSLIDFLTLPEKAKLAIRYSGDELAEGLLSLRKL